MGREAELETEHERYELKERLLILPLLPHYIPHEPPHLGGDILKDVPIAHVGGRSIFDQLGVLNEGWEERR